MAIRIERDNYASWALLQNLKDCSSLSWVCLEDFNDLLHYHEKKQGGGKLKIL